jgi:adenosine kinase
MLIVTGSIAYDYIMGFPGSFAEHILPEQIENINLSFIMDSFEKHRGGTAGNVSYTLGLLKAPHLLFSYAGKDFEEYQKAFEALEIDLSGIQIDLNHFTATGFAMADKKQNQIWGFYYGAAQNNRNLKLREVANKEDFVFIGPQGAEGCISLIKQCIKHEIPYMFDPGFILTQVSDEDLALGLQHSKYIFGNEYEVAMMKKRVTDWDNIIGNKTVITTLGENGAEISTPENLYTIQTARPKGIGATTGAGDAWRGGFLAGLQRNMDIETCGQMGAVAASFAVEHIGTQEHLYSLIEFANRFEETYNKTLEL